MLIGRTHRVSQLSRVSFLVFVVGLGCSQPREPSSPGEPQPPATPPPQASVPGEVPVEFRPEHPYWKQLRTATSSDGIHWDRVPGTLARHASSPQLVRVDGQLRVYFADNGLSIAWIPFEGGDTAAVEVEGQEPGILVDPCLLALDDGALRLFYVYYPGLADPGLLADVQVRSATATSDGAFAADPGVRVRGPWVDPDVVALPGGGARMYLTRDTRQVQSARSRDGLDFAIEPGLRFEGGGVTSTIAVDDAWWMYHHEAGSLALARSPDGLDFELVRRLPTDGLSDQPEMLESPSVLRDGERWLMVYATAVDDR
jgi:hypothetical protein